MQSLCVDCEAREKVGDKCSKWFEVNQRVREGGTLSLWLFTVFSDTIVKKASKGFKEDEGLGEDNAEVSQFPKPIELMCYFGGQCRVPNSGFTEIEWALTEWEKIMKCEGTKVVEVGKQDVVWK